MTDQTSRTFRRRTVTTLAAATAAFLVLASSQAWSDGPTYDEPTYLTAGVGAWTHHDVRINRQHPPLGKALAALPVLLLHPKIPRGEAWSSTNERATSAAFIRAQRPRLRTLLFVGRLSAIVEVVACGWLLVAIAGSLFGEDGAWLPGVLWLLSPFVIGLGHLDGIDVPFTCATLACVLAVIRARHAPSRGRLAIVGVTAGIAVLTRITGLLVVAAALVAVAALPGELRRRTGTTLAVAALAWGSVSAVYAALSPASITIAHLAVPTDWWHGAQYLLRVGSRPGPGFLLGHAHRGRWLWFWPGSIIVKWPPATVLLLAATPLGWRRLDREVRREAALAVMLPAALLGVFTLQQQRPIGLRYLLAPLALGLVLTVPLVRISSRWPRRIVAAIAVGSSLAFAAVVPALAWTDPLFGPGYRVAADSNLDWGQGWTALEAWTPSHHPYVAYFGGAGLDVAALPGARDLRAAPASITGWVAVSASALTAYDPVRLSWLRRYCPVDVLARTILVYRFAVPPDRHPSGAVAPAAPCQRHRWSSAD